LSQLPLRTLARARANGLPTDTLQLAPLHLNPGAAQEPDECRLNPTGTLPLVLPTERRKARTIQNLPEALCQQVTATPEGFHDMILQAYNKPSTKTS